MDTKFSALVADSSPFVLVGGKYALTVDIGGATAVALQAHVGGDVWLAVPSHQVAPVVSGDGGGTLPVSFAADGLMTADCPPGTYRLAVTHSEGDGADVAIVRIR